MAHSFVVIQYSIVEPTFRIVYTQLPPLELFSIVFIPESPQQPTPPHHASKEPLRQVAPP